MIPSFNGSVVTPSAVGVDESGNLVIGEKAKAQFIMAPERTVIEVKRKLGTGEKISMGRL
ncbi:MAG: Hsp70 family protein [Hungatella sp.]|jgi:molecular chaperone DnaK|nr:Hsp70 family protein [Hungatella sp.]